MKQGRSRMPAIAMAIIMAFSAIPFTEKSLLSSTASAEAADRHTGEIFYVLDKNGNAVVESAAASVRGTYIIPEEIDGHPLTELCPNAFSDCIGLTEVIIPKTIKAAAFAFHGSSIKRAMFLEGTQTVPSMIFDGASELETVILPEGTSEIGGYAFSHTNLGSIDLPESLISIGVNAFAGTPLRSIDIRNVKSMGWSVFEGCHNLTEITVPVFLSDAAGAFRGSAIKTVRFENGASEIPEYFFDGAEKLEKIYIPESVEKIGYGAFNGRDRINIEKY